MSRMQSIKDSEVPAKKRQFTVILEPESDGGYSVHCPGLPGCVSQGDDRKSALANIEEAIILVLEVLKDKGSDESPDVLLNEIKEIMWAQREDGVPVRMEIEQVELNSPVSA